MNKLIGKILNYIELETVKVGAQRLKMLRAEPLKQKIIELYREELKQTKNEQKEVRR